VARPIALTNARLADRRWRGLTIALVLNVTFVAFEALAIATAMPIVAADLAGVSLYGWVFSAFLLANLVGMSSLASSRIGSARPFRSAPVSRSSD
jgi:MFS family permease